MYAHYTVSVYIVCRYFTLHALLFLGTLKISDRHKESPLHLIHFVQPCPFRYMYTNFYNDEYLIYHMYLLTGCAFSFFFNLVTG